jgi:hypothetical protein
MASQTERLLLLVLLSSGCASSPQSAADLSRDAAGEIAASDQRALASEGAPSTCPSFDAAVATGSLESDLIRESSGLLASRINPEVFWTHNDAGDTARIFAFNRQGRHLGIYDLQGVSAVDWEDIASGPGSVAGGESLYLADIGDNSTSRAGIVVYRVAEPAVSSSQTPVAVVLSPVEKFALRYPDGAHNAETLLVDPSGGDLYVVTKSTDGISGVYLSAVPQDVTGVRTLTKVATLVFGSGVLAGTGPLATGGDVSPDGQEIIIRTYDAAVLWQRRAGLPVETAFDGPPCLLKLASEPQGEGISFDARKNFYTISEGTHSPLNYYAAR